MIFLLTEIYIDTAEIGPMKVSLRFTVDIIMQVFFSRQFHHCVLPCPGGCPGQGGDGGKTPPVKKRSEPKNAEPPAAAPKRGRRNSAGDEGAQIAKPKSKVARQNS